MVVENVRGAMEWVGRSRWNFGSFHLWGDVPALMPPIRRGSARGKQADARNEAGQKLPGNNAPHMFSERRKQRLADGLRHAEDSFYCGSSGSKARKAASAMIAKIPLPLSRHIAATYKPT